MSTFDDIKEQLNAQSQQLVASGQPPRPYDQFITEADIATYEQAIAWWPNPEVVEELPPHMQAPTPYLLASNYADLSHPHGTTFAQRLNHYVQTVCHWLTANGYSPQTPNESKEERKARKNREAQARFRTSAKQAADPLLQQRIDVEVEALGELTRNRDAALAELDAQVLAAQQEFLRLCAHRTAERARLAGLVSAQRELVAKTKRGQ